MLTSCPPTFVTLLTTVLIGTDHWFARQSQVDAPVDQTGEYFGFHALAGRASSALGPLMFGLVMALAGRQRAAMASLAFFLVAGGWLLLSIQSDRYDKDIQGM